MNLTNNDIFVINQGLDELSQIKLNGTLALKVFREKKKIEQALEPVFKAIQSLTSEEEISKIGLEEADITIDPFEISIFETIEELKAETLLKLDKIIKE